QIWLDMKLKRMCIAASIEKIDFVTESDYDLALVVLKKQKESKLNYQNLLWSNLRARIPKELCKEKISEEVSMQYSKIDELNQIWKIIEDAIINVGKKALLFKDIKNELGKQSPRSKECRDLKAIKLLSILISAIRKNQDSRSLADWRKWNKLIN
ncbi:1365_t:CDS:2, partial [Gigaspora margarita]